MKLVEAGRNDQFGCVEKMTAITRCEMAVPNERLVLDDLYAQVPALSCRRKCVHSCKTGPIFMGQVEWERICEHLGYAPRGDPAAWVCPMLRNDTCTVYRVRPMLCRLWGVTEGMACPHGCQPERRLTRGEGHTLLNAVYAIAGKNYDLWGEEQFRKERNVKHVPFKIVKMQKPNGEVIDLSYKAQIARILSLPSDRQQGVNYEDMRRSLRVLDALDAAGDDGVDLEDADYEYMAQRVKAARFAFVCKELAQFMDDVTGA